MVQPERIPSVVVDPYASTDVHCSARSHLVSRSRLALLAGGCAVCAQCLPSPQHLWPVDVKVWLDTFVALQPYSNQPLVEYFLPYCARVFFLDLHAMGGEYAERYTYHRSRKYTLAGYGKVLPGASAKIGASPGTYYQWEKMVKETLELPQGEILRPKGCAEALQLFRRTYAEAREEAELMEVVLCYFFLFECARRVPLPPPPKRPR